MLAVVKRQWHWVRRGTIKHSTSIATSLLEIYAVILSVLFEGWKKRHFWVHHKKKWHVHDTFGWTQKDGFEYEFVFFRCRGGRSKPAICYNTRLKRLRIGANAVGVAHSVTVSMAVNQRVSIHLGRSKSARSTYNGSALIKRAANAESCPIDIHSYGNRGQKTWEHKGWRQINYHSHFAAHHSKRWILWFERPF